MVKRKFKDIEKDDGKKKSPPPQRSKRQKKEEHEDSGRIVTLANKKRMASRYNKTNVEKIVSIKNISKEEEEKEERIIPFIKWPLTPWPEGHYFWKMYVHFSVKVTPDPLFHSETHFIYTEKFTKRWTKIWK